MTAAEATAYLHGAMPLTGAMGLSVLELHDGLAALALPLGPNLNHRQTVFGGSLSAAAIAAGWTLVHFRLRAEDLAARVVIQDAATDFLLPARGACLVKCAVEGGAWAEFAGVLARKHRARLELAQEVWVGPDLVARARGTYVALRPPFAPAGEL